jgi:hypothetical protein
MPIRSAAKKRTNNRAGIGKKKNGTQSGSLENQSTKRAVLLAILPVLVKPLLDWITSHFR